MLDFPSEGRFGARLETRVQRGRGNHASGRQAERAVRTAAEGRGWRFIAERWRCAAGELDLIFRDGAEYVVIEVKSAATCDAALSRITPRQVARLYRAAEIFLATTPEGSFARIRFDAGLVDRHGTVQLMENALLPY